MSGKHKKRKRASSSEDRDSEKLRKKIKQIEAKLRRLKPKQRASSSRKRSPSSTSEERESPEKSNQGGKFYFHDTLDKKKTKKKRLTDGGSLPQGWTYADQNPMTVRSYSQDKTTSVHDFRFFYFPLDTNLRESYEENDGANDKENSTPNLTQAVNKQADTVSEGVVESDTVSDVVVQPDTVSVDIPLPGDSGETVDELDEGILAKLGDDPTVSSLEDLVLHPQLATRWKVWLVKGLSQDQRDSVLKKYSRKGAVSLESPKLNAEVLKAIPEMTQRRDEHFMQTQNSIGSALAALGEAITMLLSNRDEDISKELLVEKLCDSGKILTNVFYTESQARKAYITPALTTVKPILDKALTDEFLYGSDLGEKIKEASALEKLSQGLKPQRPIQKGTPGNWKSPPVKAKQVGEGQKYKFKSGMKFKQAPKEQPRTQNRGGYQSNNRGGYQGTNRGGYQGNNRGGYQSNWNNNKNY